MKRFAHFQAALLTSALLLAACSPEATPAGNVATSEAVPAPSATPSPAAVASASPSATAKAIGLDGLGDLRIGEAVPAGSDWQSRGAQASDQCTIVTSTAYPGVYAILEGGRVRRITVGKRSDVKLVEGIGVGSPEADVRKWFAGFRETPHKYEEAPAKYLTAPGAEKGGPALRFEIGRDGRVALIHVGTMPALGYVEGCA
jgi:hypothetical protein